MFGNERFPFASSGVFRRPVEVTLWDGSVVERCRWEQSVDIAVLVDEPLRHNPEDLSPDFADGMDTPVIGFNVQCLVCRRVDGLIL